MKTPSKTVQRRKISKLRSHPKQDTIFGDVPPQELDALASDMAEHGQRDPVEILPDGTIIAGHQRVRAAKKLRWTEVDVIVRHDLVAAGEAAIEAYFVTSNLIRRQLTPLARARCIRRLLEVETGTATRHQNCWDRDELKRRVGQAMGMSARNVSRYLLVLDAPIEVQHALDRGEIKLTDAGKVAMLAATVQAEIAERIAAGENAGEVVREHLTGGQAGDEVHRAYVRLQGALGREVPRLVGRAAEIKPRRLRRQMEVLKAGRALLDELIEAAESEDDSEEDGSDMRDIIFGFGALDSVSRRTKRVAT